ncbi:hypothetical protein [Hymenobacter weizhouensis]|uniref:hypothetical protein n=1 Tax=Hymenobacter sp. YIM 151500-1 TaxID=2987689 RepID=UPI002226E0CC|nr:hypothetical protein [Hymenobacter sp. YIM 151500-1]UYZ61415.1 hypothetical protein OIS53_10385 [Hymenobacter sp. YIM 151500-1]
MSATSAFRQLASRPWLRGLLAVLLQLVLVLYTFSKLIFNPGQYILVDHFDGIKIYFSIESFLQQPMGSGMLVHGHNYPFGEYMYYTDSTPLLIAPLHALVQAVPALAPYGLYLYDLFILSSFVLSTWLLHRIARLLALPGWLAVLVSVALPWLGPQTIRLQVGHFSLAYTPALLLVVWVLLQLYLAQAAGRPVRKWWGWLGVSLVVASYIHFYYLAILGAMSGFFLLLWIVRELRARRPWLPLAVWGGGTLLVAGIVTVGSLMLLDGRYYERPAASGGYDWIEWKLQFGAFFRGYDYNHIRFPLERMASVPYESSAYLTAFGLYAGLLIGGLALLRRLPALVRPLPPAVQFVGLLLVASLPMVSIALGETYLLDNDAYVLHNYTNPFLWLRKITDRVTQFRALGRFVWPFWWAVLLGVAWYVAQWRRHPHLRWALPVLAALLVIDTKDAMRFYRDNTQRDNLLAPGNPAAAPMRQFLGWIDFRQYQAVLPFPLYHVGSEGTPNYTIDPDDPHCNRTYQLSRITGLPMMTHKAARTPPAHAAQIVSLPQAGGPPPELLRRLDQRPILVFVDSAYYNGQNNHFRELLKERPHLLALFERTDDFIQEQRLKRIRRQGTWSLYEWYPHGQPAAGK